MQVGVVASQVVIRTMLVLLLIVQPKINRVLSGKKVIVSNLLREQNTSETTASDVNYPSGLHNPLTANRRDSQQSRAPPLTRPPVLLERYDPLPKNFELCMYRIQGILRDVTRRSSEGRPLRSSDWDVLCNEATKLSGWTDRIELNWGADAEPTTIRSLPRVPNMDDRAAVAEQGQPADDEAPTTDAEAANDDQPPQPCHMSSDDEPIDDLEQRLARRLHRDSPGRSNSDD